MIYLVSIELETHVWGFVTEVKKKLDVEIMKTLHQSKDAAEAFKNRRSQPHTWIKLRQEI